jgi:hypothetical protein
MRRRARPLLPDLERLAQTGSSELREAAEEAMRRIRSSAPLASLELREVKLVAVAHRSGGPFAYLLDLFSGAVHEVAVGARLRDAEVERIDDEAVEFARGSGAATDRVRLALSIAPAASGVPARSAGERVSIDFEGEAMSFAQLVGKAYRVKVVAPSAPPLTVRVRARGDVCPAVVERALRGTMLGHRLDRDWLLIAPRDRLARLRRLSARAASGHPISFDFRDGDYRDISRVYAEVSGAEVQVHPAGVREAVTVVFTEVAWDETFDAIAAALGRDVRFEENLIVADSPKR